MLKEMAFSAALMVSGAAIAQTPTPGGAAGGTMSPPGTPAPSSTPAPLPPTAVGPKAPAAEVAPTKPADLSAADKKFIEKVASANQAEIQSAQMAAQKASDQHVKDVAQQMLTDHTDAGQKLTALAQQKGVTIPGELAPTDQKQVDKFSKLDGKKFDRAYVKAEIKDHKEMLAVLKKESTGGKDSDVKSFAAQLMPTIQKHLDMLENKTAG
jgi:putative membrane protein